MIVKSKHKSTRFGGKASCRSKTCCVGESKYARGVPVCAALCLCVFCARSAGAQENPSPRQEVVVVEPTKERSEEPAPVEEVVSPPQEEVPSDGQRDVDAASPSDGEGDVDAAEEPPVASDITLPRVVTAVEAKYPPTALEEGREANLELFVTVSAEGYVVHTDVAVSAGPEFDSAALAAMHAWHFEPAQRDGEAVPCRIRVPFQFTLPRVLPPEEQEAPLSPAQVQVPEEASEEVVVLGERELREEQRSASDFRLEREVLSAAPHEEGAGMLSSAPGVYLGRAEGGAVAHNYMLRGFDAEHGQDIEFRVGGLPINMPAHIHGQGYADLGFLIGDTIQEIRVSEGIYDPRQSDFALAGSINVDLGVAQEERGVTLRSEYGSFNTFRQTILWAPENAPEESFGAVKYMRTDGFGENRGGHNASGVFQHRFGEGKLTYRAIGVLHAARSDMAGVVRTDDVESGDVCFECVYPYPTARAQNALANRFLGGLFADYRDDDGSNGQIGGWIGYDNFRMQQNFTGFMQKSRTLERVGGLGDLIEQQNTTISLGLTGRYRTRRYRPASWASGTLEVGGEGRFDVIDQSQNLLDAAARNQTWDQRVDAGVRVGDIGLWGDLDWAFGEHVRYRFGMRADVLTFDIDDRLGNFAPLTRPQDTYIVGFRRSALGTAWGPRTSLEVSPSEWLSLLAAYGEGYRSPQARQLDDGEKAPFTKVRSADVGTKFDFGDPLSLTLSGYFTHLSDDVAFDASEGRLERIGATERKGFVAYVVSKPWPWLLTAASVTFVDATLLEPPPPTADEPQPPYEDGQKLPYVPPVVVRLDTGVTRTLFENSFGKSLIGKLGLGFSYLSSRPLPYGAYADPVSLLDASAGVAWGPVELSMSMFNLLDTQYAAMEYSFSSDWNPNDGVRPRTPARHTSAGQPRSWLISLGVTL